MGIAVELLLLKAKSSCNIKLVKWLYVALLANVIPEGCYRGLVHCCFCCPQDQGRLHVAYFRQCLKHKMVMKSAYVDKTESAAGGDGGWVCRVETANEFLEAWCGRACSEREQHKVCYALLSCDLRIAARVCWLLPVLPVKPPGKEEDFHCMRVGLGLLLTGWCRRICICFPLVSLFLFYCVDVCFRDVMFASWTILAPILAFGPIRASGTVKWPRLRHGQVSVHLYGGACDPVCRSQMVSCCIPYDVFGGPVEWFLGWACTNWTHTAES